MEHDLDIATDLDTTDHDPAGLAPDHDRVERSVTLDAPVERAWELLTRPDDLAGWLGTEVELDPTPGAEGHVRDHDGTHRRLVVDEVIPGERIAWRWWIDDDHREPEPSRVAITLTPAIGGTRVDVIEHRLPMATARASSERVGAGAARLWGHRLLHLELVALLAVHARV